MKRLLVVVWIAAGSALVAWAFVWVSVSALVALALVSVSVSVLVALG